MSRPVKKKTTKKKAATKARSRATKSVVVDEFDCWAEKQKRGTSCAACADEDVTSTLQSLLRSMIRKRAFKVTIREILKMIECKHPESSIGQRGLERHLRHCERPLYDRARGRRNG